VMGNHVKEGIPWATFTGLTALRLAEQGFSGPADILDHPQYYHPQQIVAELGSRWAIETVYFKPYACCRWIHSALDSLLHLIATQHLSADQIRRVDVHTFTRAVFGLNNYPNPSSLESAQYSLPFCLALAALKGTQALLPLTTVWLGHEELETFARKITLHADPVFDSLFPAQAAARVVLQTERGVCDHRTDFPFGDPANPMLPDDLIRKFHFLTENILPQQQREELLAAILALPQQNVSQLFSQLHQPLFES